MYHCHYCFRKLYMYYPNDNRYQDYNMDDELIDRMVLCCKCGCVEHSCNSCFDKLCENTDDCEKLIHEGDCHFNYSGPLRFAYDVDYSEIDED